MEFGKVTVAELKKIDFTLPPDHEDTAKILKKKKKKAQVYVGCAKWGRKDWVGKIYPKGTKEGDFLQFYGKQFNSIELNSTFYNLPTLQQIEKWYQVTPKDFLFVPKFTSVITHLQRLKNTRAQVDDFLLTLSHLKEKLGPVFVMPHPQMDPKSFDIISQFLDDLPADLEIFLELRHPDWYLEENFDLVFNLMKKKKAGSIITDSSGRRDCVHMRLTTPDAFIRFVGNALHPTDYARIDDWVDRIGQWLEQGLERLFFFMHQHEELHSPELCRYLIQQLNAKCGTHLHAPQFVQEESRSLF